MKLIVKKDLETNFGYYILLCHSENTIENTMVDKKIAEILDISLETYINILKQYNAYDLYYPGDCYFKTKEDAENAIKELTPYLVLATIME